VPPRFIIRLLFAFHKSQSCYYFKYFLVEIVRTRCRHDKTTMTTKNVSAFFVCVRFYSYNNWTLDKQKPKLVIGNTHALHPFGKTNLLGHNERVVPSTFELAATAGFLSVYYYYYTRNNCVWFVYLLQSTLYNSTTV